MEAVRALLALFSTRRKAGKPAESRADRIWSLLMRTPKAPLCADLEDALRLHSRAERLPDKRGSCGTAGATEARATGLVDGLSALFATHLLGYAHGAPRIRLACPGFERVSAD